MKKDTIIGTIVLLIIIVGIFSYTVLRPAPVKAPTTSEVVGLPNDGYLEHAQYYDITANYATSTPLLATANTAADTAATALMKQFVSDTITQFKTDGNFANLTAADVKMMGFDQGRKEKLQIMYLIAPASHTVSYLFTVYMDTLGAHGNIFFRTFTFDLSAGKELALADLFMPGSDYLNTLSSLARAKLPGVIGKYADTGMIQNGTTPESKNFSNFFVNGSDLVFLFEPYAVASYALGPQTLRIPLSELSSLLKPKYK